MDNFHENLLCPTIELVVAKLVVPQLASWVGWNHEHGTDGFMVDVYYLIFSMSSKDNWGVTTFWGVSTFVLVLNGMIWVISNQLHISLWGVCLGIDPHLYFSPGFFQMLSFLIWNVQSFINPKFINQWYLKIWILGSTAIKQCLLSCPYHWLINFGLSCPYHFSDHFRKHSYLSMCLSIQAWNYQT